MKLIYRIIYRISLAMVLILAVWAVLFYFAIMGVVNDEVDDQLDDYSEQIMIKALSGEELPAVSNGTNNQYYLEEISAAEALSQPQISYADEEVFIVWLDETEPARLRHTIFKNMEDRYFKLTVATPTFEKRISAKPFSTGLSFCSVVWSLPWSQSTRLCSIAACVRCMCS